MNKYSIKNLPDAERPYEKCISMGPYALSDAELLAVIIKSGTNNMSAVELARQILTFSNKEYGLNVLYKHNLSTLKSIKGVGDAKAVTILCILEIAQRISKSKKTHRVLLDTPKKVAMYYMEELRHLEKENVLIALLDSKNQLLGTLVSSIGTINSSLFSPREILVDALKNNAVGIIILHNHPSGDPSPSKEDLIATHKILDASKIIGINMLDHIIIGDKTFYSFKEENII